MKSVYITLLISISVSLVSSQLQCRLPEKKMLVDWQRLSGEWYEILNANVTVDELSSNCYGMKEIQQTELGGVLKEIDYHLSEKTYDVITVRYILNRNSGYYWIGSEADYKWTLEFGTDVSGRSRQIGEVAKKIAKTLSKNLLYIFTDYDNVIIFASCLEESIEGQNRGIWAYGRSTNTTANDVLRVVNQLVHMGDEWSATPLFRTGCVGTELAVYCKNK
ncbi:uncharacterized protein LOC144432039 [Styela clava]